MPSFLSNIRLHIVYEKLRVEVSLANRKDLRFSELATILDKQVQRARYEEFLINLAIALEEYSFWFPAFIEVGFIEQVFSTFMKGIWLDVYYSSLNVVIRYRFRTMKAYPSHVNSPMIQIGI
jgi:hypothetical protein